LILECAGGEFWHRPLPGSGQYRMIANNGLLRASWKGSPAPRAPLSSKLTHNTRRRQDYFNKNIPLF
jgi:hypothetical protein